MRAAVKRKLASEAAAAADALELTSREPVSGVRVRKDPEKTGAGSRRPRGSEVAAEAGAGPHSVPSASASLGPARSPGGEERDPPASQPAVKPKALQGWRSRQQSQEAALHSGASTPPPADAYGLSQATAPLSMQLLSAPISAADAASSMAISNAATIWQRNLQAVSQVAMELRAQQPMMAAMMPHHSMSLPFAAAHCLPEAFLKAHLAGGHMAPILSLAQAQAHAKAGVSGPISLLPVGSPPVPGLMHPLGGAVSMLPVPVPVVPGAPPPGLKHLTVALAPPSLPAPRPVPLAVAFVASQESEAKAAATGRPATSEEGRSTAQSPQPRGGGISPATGSPVIPGTAHQLVPPSRGPSEPPTSRSAERGHMSAYHPGSRNVSACRAARAYRASVRAKAGLHHRLGKRSKLWQARAGGGTQSPPQVPLAAFHPVKPDPDATELVAPQMEAPFPVPGLKDADAARDVEPEGPPVLGFPPGQPQAEAFDAPRMLFLTPGVSAGESQPPGQPPQLQPASDADIRQNAWVPYSLYEGVLKDLGHSNPHEKIHELEERIKHLQEALTLANEQLRSGQAGVAGEPAPAPTQPPSHPNGITERPRKMLATA
mmetsp:Transcript_23004/g.63879  ORF Transcript_23004/g.63879 Transcript_23004/m.63879 type:complete len:602 (-) Transcript_23004:173-1978(-)